MFKKLPLALVAWYTWYVVTYLLAEVWVMGSNPAGV
jgi:hypothetical protein